MKERKKIRKESPFNRRLEFDISNIMGGLEAGEFLRLVCKNFVEVRRIILAVKYIGKKHALMGNDKTRLTTNGFIWLVLFYVAEKCDFLTFHQLKSLLNHNGIQRTEEDECVFEREALEKYLDQMGRHCKYSINGLQVFAI
jgi:hypothetical protein